MIIEGKNAVYEAINGNLTINRLFVQNNINDNMTNRIIKLAKDKNIKIDFVSKTILDAKSAEKRHQGFLCDVVDFAYCSVEDIFKKAENKNEPPLILILDGIEDPHNFGAIIRTAECAGVHGIVIPERRACLVNDTVVKTSAGATANMLISRVTNLNTEIDKLKEKNVWVFGLEVGGKDMYKCNLTGGIALVVGSEGFGISRLTKEKCDDLITLPMKGQINSLNASVATGIAVYEILKQRG